MFMGLICLVFLTEILPAELETNMERSVWTFLSQSSIVGPLGNLRLNVTLMAVLNIGACKETLY